MNQELKDAAYNPQKLEPKWQQYWDKNKAFKVLDDDRSRSFTH